MSGNFAVEHNSPTAVFQSKDLGPTTSLYLMFARFQLDMAAQAKQGALDRLDAIRETQEQQKMVADFLQEARALQLKAKSTDTKQQEANEKSTGEKESTKVPDDMLKFLKDHNLAYNKDGDETRQNEKEWDAIIQSLEDYQEGLGMDTQQQMVYVQDFMGQYNSYLQGANTQISNSNQTLTSLARGQ